MNGKRGYALAASGVLLVALLAGCSGGDKTAKANTQACKELSSAMSDALTSSKINDPSANVTLIMAMMKTGLKTDTDFGIRLVNRATQLQEAIRAGQLEDYLDQSSNDDTEPSVNEFCSSLGVNIPKD